MTVFLACAAWMIPGWAVGSAFGPFRWPRNLACWWQRRRPGYQPRHELAADLGAGEVVLSVPEEARLASLVAQFGPIENEIASEIGALVADEIRRHELGTDLEATRYQLAVIDGLHAAIRQNPELIGEPGFAGAMAIAVNAVFELSAQYRALV